MQKKKSFLDRASIPALFFVLAALYLSNVIGNRNFYGFSILTIPAAAIAFVIMASRFKRTNAALAPALVFSCSWLIAFYLNRFRYSDLQYNWSVTTELYILIVPILCFFLASGICYFFSGYKGRIPERFPGDPDFASGIAIIAMAFISISYIILFYEFYTTGIIPALSSDISADRMSYTLPTIHVISEFLLKSGCFLVIYSYISQRKRIYLMFSLISIFYFILTASRSGVIEILLFSSFVYMMSKNYGLSSFSGKLIPIIFSILIIFSVLGNVREGSDFSIDEYAQSRISNSTMSWFYSYFAVNMDNLALEMDYGSPNYNPSNTLSLFIEVFQLDKTLSWYDPSYDYIGRLNLGTGVRGFVNDWGNLGAAIALFVMFFIISKLYSSRFKSGIEVPFKAYILVGCFMMALTNRFLEIIPFAMLLTFYLMDRFGYRAIRAIGAR